MNKQTVHYVNHSPSPYMAALFRALTAVPELDLRVHHVLSTPPERPWMVSLTEGYCERAFHTRFGLDWTLIRAIASERNSFLLSACWGDPTNQLCILIAILLGRRYAIFNDAPNVERRRNPLKAAIRGAFLRLAFRHATAVLGTGEPTLRLLAAMGAPKEKLFDFPYFIDPSAFSRRQRWYDGSGPLIFVSSGRLTAEKAYSDCMEALAQICQTNFVYRLMGTGPELENLRRLAKDRGLADRVEFLGWVDPEQSRAIFESGDIFLHPCQFEPFGVVIAEAMAAGLIVIASGKTYAALDRITDGENGFIYETNSINQLRRKIDFVIGQPSQIQSISKKAREKAEEWPLSRAQRIIKAVVST